MWEYKIMFIMYKTFQELTNELNEFGKDNWEVIHYEEEKPEKYGNDYKAKILLKRPKIVQHE